MPKGNQKGTPAASKRRVFIPCRVHRQTFGRHIAKPKKIPCSVPPCRWEEKA